MVGKNGGQDYVCAMIMFRPIFLCAVFSWLALTAAAQAQKARSATCLDGRRRRLSSFLSEFDQVFPC